MIYFPERNTICLDIFQGFLNTEVSSNVILKIFLCQWLYPVAVCPECAGAPLAQVASILPGSFLPARPESSDTDPMREPTPPPVCTCALTSAATGFRVQTTHWPLVWNTNSWCDIYIGAAKGIGAARFAEILGHLKKTFLTFSFRIIYFRMFRSRVLKKSLKKFFRALILS